MPAAVSVARGAPHNPAASATIADSASVENSDLNGSTHVMDGATVKDATLTDTLVFPDAHVEDAELTDTVFDEKATVEGIDLTESLIGSYSVVADE